MDLIGEKVSHLGYGVGTITAIEGDNITSIYYDKENSLLIAGIKTLVEKNIYYLTKIYKVIFNKRDESNIEIDMEQKYGGLVNNQNSMIISILKIMVY